MERLPEELNNQIFQKLKSIVEVERMTANERLEYELSLATERDLLACMATQFEEGEAKGLAEGLRRVAANLKKQGIALAAIVAATGLDAETINEL